MLTKKIHLSPLLFSFLMLIFSTTNSFAEEIKPEFSETRETSISKHCSSIKETLKATQRSDSHARTYLGSIYEVFLTKFITPFNVRSLKNNKSISELTEIQTKFVETRTEFNSSFVTYSKSLEDLINTDCTASPQDFYAKLENTREERVVVDEHVKKLEQLISMYKQKVIKMEKK